MKKWWRPRALIGWLACVLLVAACSPEYNWREIHDQTDGWSALLPARAAAAARDVKLGELTLEMRMRGAVIGESTFAVGAITMPPGTSSGAAAAVELREALIRNIAGKITRLSTVSLPAEHAQVTATGIVAEGKVSGRVTRVVARFVARDQHAYQVVAVGPDLDVAQAQTFVESFKLQP